MVQGKWGSHVLTSILAAPEAGFNVKAFFSDTEMADDTGGKPHYGGVDHAIDYAHSHPLDQVWIAMPLSEAERINMLVNELSDVSTDIRLVPDIYGFQAHQSLDQHRRWAIGS